jgi:hypothetical protein
MFTDKSTRIRSFISAVTAISLSLLMAASFVHSTDSVQWLGSDALTDTTIASTVDARTHVRFV